MAINPIHRIVVFTGDLNFSVRAGIRALLDAFDDVEIEVLLHRPRRKPSRLVKNQFRNLRKHGVSWIPYQAWDVGSRLLHRGDPGSGLHLPMPGRPYTMDDLAADGRVRITVSPSVNGAAAQRIIEDWSRAGRNPHRGFLQNR